MAEPRSLLVAYDGECPFCRRYVRLLRLRERFAEVRLVDLRQDAGLRARYGSQGLDVDRGMVVELDGATWHGADALWLLAGLSGEGGPWSRLNRWLLGSRRRARLAYPLLRAGRRVALLLLGRPPL